MARLADYMQRKDFESILKKTNDYNMFKGIDSESYAYKIGFRVEVLVTLGRFEEAEKLCYEALETHKLDERREGFLYYYLYLIYYYTKQYYKCIEIIKRGYIHDSSPKSKTFQMLFSSIASEGKPDLYEKLFDIPKHVFVKHVLKRRAEDVRLDLNKLYDVIQENFYNAQPYYENFSMFRIFRCFNAGKTDYNDKPDLCNYIHVVSTKDDPNTMITCYFISDPGSLSYYDITSLVFAEKMEKNKSNNEVKHNIDKFNQRQRKMKK